MRIYKYFPSTSFQPSLLYNLHFTYSHKHKKNNPQTIISSWAHTLIFYFLYLQFISLHPKKQMYCGISAISHEDMPIISKTPSHSYGERSFRFLIWSSLSWSGVALIFLDLISLLNLQWFLGNSKKGAWEERPLSFGWVPKRFQSACRRAHSQSKGENAELKEECNLSI